MRRTYPNKGVKLTVGIRILNGHNRRDFIPTCRQCDCDIDIKHDYISKRNKQGTKYYHKECWDKMYYVMVA